VRRRLNILATNRAKIPEGAALASKNENAYFPENALTPYRDPIWIQNFTYLAKSLVKPCGNTFQINRRTEKT
jgi:hypothetical protein